MIMGLLGSQSSINWFTILTAQQPTIAPLSYTAFLDPSDVSVRFTCTGEGFVSWMVDGNPATETEIIKRGIFTDSNEEGGNFTSQITIPATVENNNTEVQCFATLENRSEVVSFKVQGTINSISPQSHCSCPQDVVINVHQYMQVPWVHPPTSLLWTMRLMHAASSWCGLPPSLWMCQVWIQTSPHTPSAATSLATVAAPVALV